MNKPNIAQALKDLDQAATSGVWGQYNPSVGPWQELAKNDIKNMDSSHHMSALIDGKPKRLSEWTHADDAAFAEFLVNAYRSGDLVPKSTEQALTEALRECELVLEVLPDVIIDAPDEVFTQIETTHDKAKQALEMAGEPCL